MEVGWTCSLCRMETAESFCCCGNSETLLCRKCLSTHYDKFPKRMHQKMPLAAYGHHRAPGYFDRLNARTQAIETGKEELMKQLQSTDRCLEEISTKINELCQRIWEAGQQACEGVKRAHTALQAKVQLSIEEAERTVYEDSPKLSEIFSPMLRTFTGEFPLTLFQHEVKVCGTMDSIFKVTYKSATELPQFSKSASAQPTSPDSKWTCSSCLYQNSQQTNAHCGKCGQKNPKDSSVKAEESKSDPPGQGSVPSTCMKKCAKCGIREVPQSTDVCSICRSAPAHSCWTCIHCLNDNNLSDERCLMCNQAMGFMQPELKVADSRLSADWRCECSYVNHSFRLSCAMCARSKAPLHCKTCGKAKKSETEECSTCDQGKKQPQAGDGLRLKFSNMKIAK